MQVCSRKNPHQTGDPRHHQERDRVIERRAEDPLPQAVGTHEIAQKGVGQAEPQRNENKNL
jgi:hypothetical protein